MRAGNVIGGDWAKDRIIPDIIRSIEFKKTFTLRNPKSTRPWQHVLEPIKAYLIIAAKININKTDLTGESFNVGPGFSSSVSVEKLINKFEFTKNVKLLKKKNNKIKEAKLLALNVNKIKKTFNISQTLTLNQTIKYISEWYEEYFKNKKKC